MLTNDREHMPGDYQGNVSGEKISAHKPRVYSNMDSHKEGTVTLGKAYYDGCFNHRSIFYSYKHSERSRMVSWMHAFARRLED